MNRFKPFLGWFDVEEQEENFLLASTRLNGDVGTGTYGRGDWDKAQEIKANIEEAFPEATVEIDTTDEWVDITIKA
jgi:hypothetical protein